MSRDKQQTVSELLTSKSIDADKADFSDIVKALKMADSKKEYPQWVCSDCGNKHGNKKCVIATWHIGSCDVCGKEQVKVTEPRDFGHLKDGWE
jgi:hypothetical protein